MLQQCPNGPTLSCLCSPVHRGRSDPIVGQVGINALTEIELNFLASTLGSRPVKRRHREGRRPRFGRRAGQGTILEAERRRFGRVLGVRSREAGYSSEPIGSRIARVKRGLQEHRQPDWNPRPNQKPRNYSGGHSGKCTTGRERCLRVETPLVWQTDPGSTREVGNYGRRLAFMARGTRFQALQTTGLCQKRLSRSALQGSTISGISTNGRPRTGSSSTEEGLRAPAPSGRRETRYDDNGWRWCGTGISPGRWS